MNWERLLIEKRFRDPKSESEKENGRSQFEKDIDRITFSGAFRRLGRKTQVHLLSRNDHIHTRLSHSLEVASVGRSLGVMVGEWLKEKSEKSKEKYRYPKDFPPSKIGEIVEAACLAHDIGNPPFGHAAEDAIRKWFQEKIPREYKKDLGNIECRDLEHFDGNAMAFRVVAYKEYYEGSGGMRLTYPTLGALLKYPWTSHFAGRKNKFSCFKTEYNSFCEVAQKLDLIEKINDRSQCKAEYARHPLAYLVEAADDICYHVLDIEDAIDLNLLPPDYLKKRFIEKLKDELERDQKYLLNGGPASWRTKNGLLRGKMIGCMIEEVIKIFKENYDDIMKGNFGNSLFDKTDKCDFCSTLKKLYKHDEDNDNRKLKARIYRNEKNVPLELGAYSTVNMLLSTSMEAAYEIVNKKEFSYKTEIIQNFTKHNSRKLFEEKNLYEVTMLFLDYVMGMTDNYATYVNKQLLGLGN